MAPWIKMRTDLRRHPKVVRMASALNADRYRVIGGLLAVWAVFDEQTEDGFLEGYTPEAMDVEIGWPGFCAAMMAVAWLSFQEQGGLAVPEFDEHNGQSAKRRASDTKRKRDERDSAEPPQPVRAVSASRADKKTTRGREEEDKKKHPPTPKGADAAFEKFWAAYPKKVGKDAARKAFGKRDPALVGQMVQALEWQLQREQWQREDGRFIPNPATWLNQGRWEDSRPGDTTEWHETRSGVEARGIELGLGAWVETEQFPAYKSRVMKAHQQGAH